MGKPLAVVALLLALASLLLGHLAGCGEHAGSPVVARVDGEPITLDEFRAQAVFTGLSSDSTAIAPGLRHAVLMTLVRRTLVLKEAKAADIGVLPEEVTRAESDMRQGMSDEDFLRTLQAQDLDLATWRSVLGKELIKRKVLDSVVMARVRVDATRIQKYYREHPEEFQRSEQILAQHAVMPSKQLAEALLDRVRQGEDMGKAAATLGTPLVEGGQAIWLSQGHMPDNLEKEVFALEPGKLAGPLGSTYGFHVVRVLQKRPAMHLSLAQAAADIQKKLAAEDKETLAAQWVEDLLKRARVWVDNQFVDTGKAGGSEK